MALYTLARSFYVAHTMLKARSVFEIAKKIIYTLYVRTGMRETRKNYKNIRNTRHTHEIRKCGVYVFHAFVAWCRHTMAESECYHAGFLLFAI